MTHCCESSSGYIPRPRLLVTDVQNEYVTGKLRIEYPPLESSLVNIARLMDAATAAGIAVAVVQNRAPQNSPLFAYGSDGWQLHASIAERSRDCLIEKTLPSAFALTELAAWLKEQEIDTVSIAGFMTHNCDAATALDALHRGFGVEFIADAAGALSYRNEAGCARAEEIHRAFSVVLHSRFAAVVTSAEWIEAANSGRSLARSNILASHAAAAAPLP